MTACHAIKLLLRSGAGLALDADTAAQTLLLLKRLNEEMGKTLVMVTHDPRAAQRADRILYLDKGRLVNNSPLAQ